MKKLIGGVDNRISPLAFKKYMSKTIYMNSAPAGGSGVHPTTANSMEFSFKLKPNKVCVQNLTTPVSRIGDIIVGEPDLGDWGPNNVPFTQPLWCVISSNNINNLVPNKVTIKISRRIVWKDKFGSALITTE